MRKVLIVGAGNTAKVLSTYLAPNFKVTCLTNNVPLGRKFINTRIPNIDLGHLNASDPKAVAKAAKGFSLVINVSLPKFNLNIMNAALGAGANYQDLCSYFADGVTPDQLALDNDFKKAGLLALINTGVAPGITNLIAKRLSREFDKIDDVRIRIIEDMKTDGTLVYSWSPQVAIDEVVMPSLFYENGRVHMGKPLSRKEKYDFPAPYGKQDAYALQGDEVATLPLYIKANRIDMKASGSEIDILLFLQKNGLFGQKKISVNGAEISPLDFFKRIAPPPRTPKEIVSMMNRGVIKDAEFVSTVDVRGTQDGKPYRVQYTLAYPNIWRIPEAYEGSTYISYPTGIAAGIFTQASFDIKERGVLPPEALDKQTAKTILNELGRFEVNSTRRNWSPKEQ